MNCSICYGKHPVTKSCWGLNCEQTRAQDELLQQVIPEEYAHIWKKHTQGPGRAMKLAGKKNDYSLTFHYSSVPLFHPSLSIFVRTFWEIVKMEYFIGSSTWFHFMENK